MIKNSGFNIDVKNHDEIIEKIKYLSSDYSIWQRYALSARKRSLHFNKNKFNESISFILIRELYNMFIFYTGKIFENCNYWDKSVFQNNYGGFEQFAEIVSQQWVKLGYEVICYNSSEHKFKESQFNGVRIKKIFCPESKIGPFAHFIYDFLCIKDAIKENCDIYHELGYQSSAFSYIFISEKERKIITNMDGIEWKKI